MPSAKRTASKSSEGGDNYRELAEQAMEWFERSIKLNPWGGVSAILRYGWCLDWLGRTAESPRYFERAAQLEPNGYFMAANIGLHYVQAGQFCRRQAVVRTLPPPGREGQRHRPQLPADRKQQVAGGGHQRNQRQTQFPATLTLKLARNLRPQPGNERDFGPN